MYVVLAYASTLFAFLAFWDAVAALPAPESSSSTSDYVGPFAAKVVDDDWCPNPNMRWIKEKVTFKDSFFGRDVNDVFNSADVRPEPAEEGCLNQFGFTFEYIFSRR